MSIWPFVALVLAAAAVIGTVYQIAAAALVWRFVRSPVSAPAERPPISVLKPLAGDEPGLAERLRALCRVGYPTLQIVCGTLNPTDPAQAIASMVRAEFPAVDMIVVAGGDGTARNGKVASLANMLSHARHEIVVFADSDVRVGADSLDELISALAEPGAGLATCLYVGRPESTVWSRLEALWINHAFLPSALVARAIGRRDGCFGATIALRRTTLDRAGGLAPLRDLLADDWALGAAVRRLGLRIALAPRPVGMVVYHPSFTAMFAHELRWSRTIASLDRRGHIASALTQPVALALLAALVGGLASFFVVILAAVTALRLAAIRVGEGVLGQRPAPLPLLAARELLTFAVFVAALWGRTVRWRGVRYRIRRDGTMEPLKNSPR